MGNCHGFRVPKTLSDETIWYQANAYAGRLLLWAGLAFSAGSIVFALVPVLRTDFAAYNIACTVVPLAGLGIATVKSLLYLRTL